MVPSASSQPSATFRLQSPQPLSHVTIAHTRAAHVAVALAGAHGRPHIPQFDRSLSVDSQPSASTRLQSAKPPLQRNPHAEAAHVGAELGRVVHATPHAPQWFGLVVVLVSQPSIGAALQLPQPGSHAPKRHALLSQLEAAWARVQLMLHPPQ